MTAKAPDQVAAVEAILDALPAAQRVALEHLRAVIHATAPEAEEALVYGAPGFRLGGALVCYAAHKSHCAFYPMSPALLDSLGDEVADYRTAKGTLQFTPDRPLPDTLVRNIVRARVAENRARTTTPPR